MPRITIHLGGRERLHPTISKGTLLPTDALVWIGATCISGTASAMRALADALVEAADLADAYDAYNQREQAERDADR